VYDIHFRDKYEQLVTVASYANLVFFSLGVNAKVEVSGPVVASARYIRLKGKCL